MSWTEVKIAYRVSFDRIEQIVLAHVEDSNLWQILGPTSQGETIEHLGQWAHVFLSPEQAMLDSIERARKDIEENKTKIERLEKALRDETAT